MEVTAAVIYQKGKVLLMRRAKGHSSAGGWEYPGGKIEPGETGEQCLHRELQEELHIDAVIGRLLAVSNWRESSEKEIHLSAYLVSEYRGSIIMTDHDAMEWVPLEQILEHDQLPADRKISEQLKGVLL